MVQHEERTLRWGNEGGPASENRQRPLPGAVTEGGPGAKTEGRQGSGGPPVQKGLSREATGLGKQSQKGAPL